MIKKIRIYNYLIQCNLLSMNLFLICFVSASYIMTLIVNMFTLIVISSKFQSIVMKSSNQKTVQCVWLRAFFQATIKGITYTLLYIEEQYILLLPVHNILNRDSTPNRESRTKTTQTTKNVNKYEYKYSRALLYSTLLLYL